MPAHTAAFGCNSYSYMHDCRAGDFLTRLADLGFAEFELMVYPGHLWPPGPDADGLASLRRIVTSRGLRIVSLNMPNIDINIAAAAPEMRAYSLETLTGVVRLAGELGAAGVVIGPGKANPLFPAPTAELIGHFFAALDRLLPVAAEAGTALWAENMPFAFLPAIDELMNALERYGSDEIGVVYDVANAHFIGEAIDSGLARCRERLRLVHLSDTGREAYRHDPVGRGSVPFEAIPAALAAVGHERRPMLEIISRTPERDIADSASRLVAAGFAAPVAAMRQA